jgi:DNA-binding beta-propeller fold protein YncE
MQKINIILLTILLVLFGMVHLPTNAQSIYWIESVFDTPRLVKTDFDGTELLSKSLQAGSLPQTIAIDANTDALFWTELAFNNARLNSVASDLSTPSAVVDSQSALRGIAVDGVNKKIYWTASNLVTGPVIYRADMDGSSPEKMIDFGPGSNTTPRAIALDINGGKMYWANFGEGKIQRADLAVNAIPEDVLIGLNGPTGLALDTVSGKIFWTETNGHQIKCADLDGANVTLLVSGLSYPNYISVNPEIKRMAWTEIGTGTVKSADLDGSAVFDYGVKAAAPAGIVIIPSPVSISKDDVSPQLPKTYCLHQNSPNPFKNITAIKYDLPLKSAVKLTLFNIRGQVIKTVVNESQAPGYYTKRVILDRCNPGIYIYRIEAGRFTKSMPLLMVK